MRRAVLAVILAVPAGAAPKPVQTISGRQVRMAAAAPGARLGLPRAAAAAPTGPAAVLEPHKPSARQTLGRLGALVRPAPGRAPLPDGLGSLYDNEPAWKRGAFVIEVPPENRRAPELDHERPHYSQAKPVESLWRQTEPEKQAWIRQRRAEAAARAAAAAVLTGAAAAVLAPFYLIYAYLSRAWAALKGDNVGIAVRLAALALMSPLILGTLWVMIPLSPLIGLVLGIIAGGEAARNRPLGRAVRDGLADAARFPD